MLLQILFELFGIREFFPSNEVVRALASHLCNHHVARYLCENFVFLICGFDYRQMNVVSIVLFWYRQMLFCFQSLFIMCIIVFIGAPAMIWNYQMGDRKGVQPVKNSTPAVPRSLLFGTSITWNKQNKF